MTKKLSYKLFSIAFANFVICNVSNTYYAYVEAPKIWGHRIGWLNLYESPILASFNTNYNDVFVISFNVMCTLMAIAAIHHCLFE